MEDKGTFDFGRDLIYTSQPTRCSLTVEAMCEGVRLGHNFMAVEVSKNSDGSYTILEGNHRTAAHCIEKRPLDYIVLGEFDCIVKSYRVEEEIPGGVDYLRLANSLVHLPKHIAERFCKDNGQELFFKELIKCSSSIDICDW